jgi:hypothetical protein
MMIGSTRLTRRQFSAGLLAAASIGCPICGSVQAAGRILCAAAANGAPDISLRLPTSGDANLDRILSAEMIEQSRFFGLRPGFVLYGGPDENALAMSDAVVSGTQGTIFYNLGFLKNRRNGAGRWLPASSPTSSRISISSIRRMPHGSRR